MAEPDDPRGPLHAKFVEAMYALTANKGVLYHAGIQQLRAAEQVRQAAEEKNQTLSDIQNCVVEVSGAELRPFKCGNHLVTAVDLVNIINKDVVPRLQALSEPGKVKLHVQNVHGITLEPVIRALHK
eukprot:scpid107583/ scgid30074/ 